MKPSVHPDAMPVRLVICFVGAIGVLSLLIGAWLYWMGKPGEGVLAITNGCVMGLLGLLARTDTRQSNQRQGDATPPDGTPEDPVNVTASPDAPVATTDADEPEPDNTAPSPKPSPLSKVVQKS
jgi:hypothetical protein